MGSTILLSLLVLGLIIFIIYRHCVALEEKGFFEKVIDEKTSFYKKRLEEIHNRVDQLHDGMKGVVPIKYMKEINKELDVLKKAIKAIK